MPSRFLIWRIPCKIISKKYRNDKGGDRACLSPYCLALSGIVMEYLFRYCDTCSGIEVSCSSVVLPVQELYSFTGVIAF